MWSGPATNEEVDGNAAGQPHRAWKINEISEAVRDLVGPQVSLPQEDSIAQRRFVTEAILSSLGWDRQRRGVARSPHPR